MKLAGALILAKIGHADQKYGNGRPYIEHLRAVVQILIDHGIGSEEVLAAGMLHDYLEDTDGTYDEIVEVCGKRVADIVLLVTNKPGPNRKTRHEATYPALAKDPAAIIVKLADRLANVRGIDGSNEKYIQMYRKEHDYFRKTLHRGEECTNAEIQLWQEIEEALGINVSVA